MLDTTLLDGAEEEDLSLVRRESSLFTLNRCKVHSLTILVCPRTKLLPNGNPTSSQPIIHKSFACLDKASSDTVASVGVSRKVAVISPTSQHPSIDYSLTLL